jgi:hypothetical protein
MNNNTWKEEVLDLLVKVQKDVASCDISYDILRQIEKLLISEGKLTPEQSNYWISKNE